ncbi:SRPBCC family protein [Glutamicibacter mishrai]|uniref:SRPBCC family protein n=1 Tax=Glutamicibacter mishrai TaxID=1775880 RepID=UPI0020CBCE11|nr:SRPBCC family protein [Glutamicibacter mishrai]UTT39250.1 SRPBCC family protein [Glutamicibacter mishrai]
MVDVSTSIVIDRPLSMVAGYTMNPLNAPAWYQNIRSVRRLDQEDFGLGSRTAFEARFLGRDLSYTYEVTTLLEDKELVMATAQGPFPMRTTYKFETVSPTATRVELRNDGEPHGFSKLLAPLIQTMMRRANMADLRALKKTLENQ